MRSNLVATGMLAGALLLSGCGADSAETATAPTQSASATATTSSPVVRPADLLLRRLQTSVTDLGVVEVSGGTSGSAVVGRRSGVINMQTGEFRTSLQLGGNEALEMMRSADLTWSRAPADYWVQLGFTRASANAARGKWLVAPVADVKPLLESMDPGSVIRSLERLTPADLKGMRSVSRGPLSGSRVLLFGQNGAEQRIYVRDGKRPVLLRITSTKENTTTTINFDTSERSFRFRIPKPEDVVQP